MEAKRFKFIKCECRNYKECHQVMHGDILIDFFGFTHNASTGHCFLQSGSTAIYKIIGNCNNIPDIKERYRDNFNEIIEVSK